MTTQSLTVRPLPTNHRFGSGDDVVAALLDAAHAAAVTLTDGDVVCVASKIIALVEGQAVTIGDQPPEQARRTLALEHAREIVADAPQVLITRTSHGFVVANGAIDASNVADGTLLLLPDDPDASAARLRDDIRARSGVDVGVVITDTFGRPWRNGQTDVAIGLAGIPALRDERGTYDLEGHELTVTAAAIADEIAGAADLVRTKASGTPFVLLRGLPTATTKAATTGVDLVRAAEDDLFAAGGPTAATAAVTARRTVRTFDPTRKVPDAVLEAAVAAAATAPAPHHTTPWRFILLRDDTRTALLDAMAATWREDLTRDGLPAPRIDRRVARSDAVLRRAPAVVAAFVTVDGAHDYRDDRRHVAERDLFLLSGGAALQNMQIVLAAHGIGAAWISSTVFCADTVRDVLALDATWHPLGMLAIGYPDAPPAPRAGGTPPDALIER
ncbi:MAG: coenzyme F420-0:L-glutamate ligase [Nitriliruptoraceae bacterium]